MAWNQIYKLLETWIFILLLLTGASLQCGRPGPGGSRRGRPPKMTPLVFKQHVPNVSENTLGASGLSEGKIGRDSPKFKELVEMHDTNIGFRDEEGNGSDHIMSKRCKDKLKSLAISVMNQWPGVKLRVTEAWDEDNSHAADSLHYEGRAVDITTSDRDRSKYGMLARLAVEAGFDWVYYESRGHIHCSVKSDSSAAIKTGGCFPGDQRVTTEYDGIKNMSDLQVGDRVLTVTQSGHLEYNDVIIFMDRDTVSEVVYYSLKLEDNETLTLTPDHLVYVSAPGVNKNFINARVLFASNIEIGQYIYVTQRNLYISPKRVIEVRTGKKVGVYAPLTRQGTIVVNDIVASCYAVISNHKLAHLVFAPVRLVQNVKEWLGWDSSSTAQTGIHWYPNFFHKIAPYVLSKNILHNEL